MCFELYYGCVFAGRAVVEVSWPSGPCGKFRSDVLRFCGEGEKLIIVNRLS